MFELPTDLIAQITSTGLFKFFRDETKTECFNVQIAFNFYTFKKDSHDEIKMVKLVTLDAAFFDEKPEIVADTPADASAIKDFQLFSSN